MNFKSFNLHPHIESGIRVLGYTAPTPIQIQAIPPILQNRDVMGQAQTGTGKTAAFVLPILQRLMALQAVVAHGNEVVIGGLRLVVKLRPARPGVCAR